VTSAVKDIKVGNIAKLKNNLKKVFIETYGCQMNFADSEVVLSILKKNKYHECENASESDLILINTCSIREKAELNIRKKLNGYQKLKKDRNVKVGVLGCMAERLKKKFLEEEKIIDLVVGPDSYRDIPNLLKKVNNNQKAINVTLSKFETYEKINPERINSNKVSAFVSITRGCDNMCTFCVVPFTRGRERSRDPKSILTEIHLLHKRGFKEITLLGQNVDSYLWYGGGLKKDYSKATPLQKRTSLRFNNLLEIIAQEKPKMRIRFSTSNPQDMTDEVIEVIAKYPNICKHVHLPVQSGSNKILRKMNRLHTREEYLVLVNKIKKKIPNCSISHDIIVGFPSENDTDHLDTLNLMESIKYDYGYMFKYSERPGTLAQKKFTDNVPMEIKNLRLKEIILKQRKHSHFRNKRFLNKTVCVLIEKVSKKSDEFWSGRTTQNTVVVFPKKHFYPGDFVDVRIENCTSATLIGNGLRISKNI
jgi:tRNA-2-methylthio-N6-dimethylallyladenosine synthase